MFESDITSPEERANLWFERMRRGRAWLSAMKLTEKLPRYTDFYEGRQWPAPTARTADLPRPVVNVVKLVVRNKKGQVLSTPVRCLYQSDDESVSEELLDELNEFSRYIDKEIGQEKADRRAVTQAAVKGTAVYHYYWDTEARGLNGRCDGGLRVELINPLHMMVANPSEPDVQKQKWVIFASRESVDEVRLKADAKYRADIRPDEDELRDGDDKREQEGSSLVTVVTAYFRRNGEVYVEKCVENTVIVDAHPITPDVEAEEMSLAERQADDDEDGEDGMTGEDPGNGAGADKPDGDGHEKSVQGARSYLYPIVVYCYEPREDSIYGLGEAEGVIPNQRLINAMLAFMCYHVQMMAWDKYVVTPDALGDQEITNEPGQVITDYSLAGNGVRRLTAAAMSGSPEKLVDLILTVTRSVTGTSEVMTGELQSGSLSGAAIANLQSQAQVPSEDIRQAFWRAKEEQGRIKAQFFRNFYREKEYIREIRQDETDEDGEQRVMRRREIFNSDPYRDAVMDVVCEATSGTRASAAGDIALLESLHDKGEITAEALVRAYPKDALGARSEILRAIREVEARQVEQLTEQNRQLQEALAQSAQRCDEMQKGYGRVEALIDGNTRLQEALAVLKTQYEALRAEATEAINAANVQIEAGNARIEELIGEQAADDFEDTEEPAEQPMVHEVVTG